VSNFARDFAGIAMQRLSAFSVCLLLVTSTLSSAQQLPTVNKDLVVRGVPIGQVFEKFRPQLAAYFREIEAEGDYPNYSVPPAKAFEQ